MGRGAWGEVVRDAEKHAGFLHIVPLPGDVSWCSVPKEALQKSAHGESLSEGQDGSRVPPVRPEVAIPMGQGP